MKERPILFSAEMVRAILEGRKTQTRRVITPQPPNWKWNTHAWDDRCVNVKTGERKDSCCVISPYGKPNDLLWVRETWASHPFNNKLKPSELLPHSSVYFRADEINKDSDFTWRPSIFMPHWARERTLVV